MLECVGSEQSLATALDILCPWRGDRSRRLPHYEAITYVQFAFYRKISLGGAPAPVRAYIAELLPNVLEVSIARGPVFNLVVELQVVPDGCRRMTARESIKVMVKPWQDVRVSVWCGQRTRVEPIPSSLPELKRHACLGQQISFNLMA